MLTRVITFTYKPSKAIKISDTYAIGVQREEPWVFKGLLMFIPGQTHSTVSPAKLPTWTTSSTPLGGSHKQWLTLLTVLTLEWGGGM